MTSQPGVLRGAGTMALGTMASRATGFLRTAVLVAVLGVKGVALAFTVANTAPNIVYELLLGGILTSVLVPVLVRAAKDDEDGGEAYAQRLLSLTVVALTAAALLLVLLALGQQGFTPDFRVIDSEADLRKALAEAEWDLVLSDFALLGFGGKEALRLVQESGKDLPFIIVSGAIGEEAAVEAMAAGASDYVMKDKLARLAREIERELAIRVLDEAIAKIEADQEQARLDVLAQTAAIVDTAVVEREPEAVTA